MKTKNLLIKGILLFQGFFSLLQAAEVYVTNTAELSAACTNAASGDVIYAAAGTYTGPFVLSSKSNVTLTSYNGMVAIEGTGGIALLEIYNSSNITINQLILRNNIGNFSEGVKIHGYGSNINVTNCEIYNIGWTSSKSTMPSSSNSAHAIVVIGSATTSISNVFIGGNNIHDCITGYSESITLVGNVELFLVEGNTLAHNTNIGIDAAGHFSWTGAPESVNYARSGIIRKNVVSNYAGPAALDAAGGIYIDGGSYITIENNIVYNYKVGFSVGCEVAGHSNYGNIIRNNLAYNCSLSGLFLGSNTSSMVYNTEVYNNTFYKCGTGTYDNGQIALQNNSGSVLENNILYPTDWRYAIVQMGGTSSSSLSEMYNLYWRDNGNTDNLFYNVAGATNAVLQNPLFVNAANSNFHVSESSPVVNAGNPISEGSGQEDLDGNARVQNNRVDIGVYETFCVTIDGLTADWDELLPIATNADIVLKAYSNDSNIYLAAIGNLNESYQFFINTDNDPLTGFTDLSWSASGADYLIENGTLYQHTGSGWSWISIANLTALHNSNLTELSIPKSTLSNLANTLYFGYKDLQSWTNAGIVPAIGSTMASYTPGSVTNDVVIKKADNIIVANQPEVNIYPNPAIRGKVTIALKSFDDKTEVLIYSLNGELIQNQTLSSIETTIDISQLQVGLYFVKVSNQHGSTTQKLVVLDF